MTTPARMGCERLAWVCETARGAATARVATPNIRIKRASMVFLTDLSKIGQRGAHRQPGERRKRPPEVVGAQYQIGVRVVVEPGPSSRGQHRVIGDRKVRHPAPTGGWSSVGSVAR